MPVLKLAWRNVRSNWLRSLASILSITSGFVALCLFQGFLVDMQGLFSDILKHQLMISHVLIQKVAAEQSFDQDPLGHPLSADEQAFVDAFLKAEGDEIVTRVRFLGVTGIASNGSTTSVFMGYGYDLPEGARIRGEDWQWNTLAGEPLDLAPEGENIIVGRKLGLLLDCDVQPVDALFQPSGAFIPEERPFTCATDSVQLQVSQGAQLNVLDAHILGIADSGLREVDDKFTVMPLKMAQTLVGEDAVTMYTVELAHPRERDAFIQRLGERARAQGVEVEAIPWQDHPRWGGLYRRSDSLLGVFRTFVVGVVALISAMAIANTLTRSVVERTRDIGALRSMGYRRSHIQGMFTAEGFMLALIACGLGLALTLLLTTGINLAGFTYPEGVSSYPVPLRIRYVPAAYVLATLGLCSVSTLAALWPARRGAQMKVVDALTHV